MSFLPPPGLRQLMSVPTQDKIDFRAACFCHKNIVDIGFVCSVCLSSKSYFHRPFHCSHAPPSLLPARARVLDLPHQVPDQDAAAAERIAPERGARHASACGYACTRIHARGAREQPPALDEHQPARRPAEREQRQHWRGEPAEADEWRATVTVAAEGGSAPQGEGCDVDGRCGFSARRGSAKDHCLEMVWKHE